MTENITNLRPQIWKAGQSGNPKGRPPRNRALTEILRLQGKEAIEVNGTMISAQEIVAKALWHLAAHGEVWLSGRRLSAESVSEWVNVVKWLYTYIEPPKNGEGVAETEMVVRVVREDAPLENDNEYPDEVEYEEEATGSVIMIPSNVQGEDE